MRAAERKTAEQVDPRNTPGHQVRSNFSPYTLFKLKQKSPRKITETRLEAKVKEVDTWLHQLYRSDFTLYFTNSADCYEKCLLYITVVFDRRKITKHQTLKEFKRLNVDVLTRIYGSNFIRQRKPQPTVFAYTDFEATRYGRGSVEELNPHVHALALVPPEIRFKYQILLGDRFGRKRSLNTIDSVHVEQYRLEKRSVEELISYCMKGLRGKKEDELHSLEMVLGINAERYKPATPSAVTDALNELGVSSSAR